MNELSAAAINHPPCKFRVRIRTRISRRNRESNLAERERVARPVFKNLSTDAGEKVARRWLTSRFAAGAGAGCAVQTLRERFRLRLMTTPARYTRMNSILRELLLLSDAFVRMFLRRRAIPAICVVVAAKGSAPVRR